MSQVVVLIFKYSSQNSYFFYRLGSSQYICPYCSFYSNRNIIQRIEHMHEWHTDEFTSILDNIHVLNNAVRQIDDDTDQHPSSSRRLRQEY